MFAVFSYLSIVSRTASRRMSLLASPTSKIWFAVFSYLSIVSRTASRRMSLLASPTSFALRTACLLFSLTSRFCREQPPGGWVCCLSNLFCFKNSLFAVFSYLSIVSRTASRRTSLLASPTSFALRTACLLFSLTSWLCREQPPGGWVCWPLQPLLL